MNTPHHNPPPAPGWVLAVDFGTSNTAAAHTGIRSGSPETLPLTHQGNLMSSAVFVESPTTIDVGDVALNRAETNPAAFIPSPKRVVGQGMVHVNGYDIPASLPVAAVLRFALDRATGVHRGQPPARLILTHPEGWSPREIEVLRDAAAALGYQNDSVVTVSEPRAAAHFYTRTEHLVPGAKIAVFDFGGGTLDVAVLTATSGDTFEVIASRGDNSLGGKNLDALVRRWVDIQLQDENPELLHFLRTAAPAHILRTLDDSIRRAKELLSSTESATISVVDSRHDRRETLTLTRGEFESIIAPEIERAAALTHAALVDAGLSGPQGLTALYLTGGSSRIPLVQSRIAALGPIATLDDPKTVVVQGALIATTRSSAAPTDLFPSTTSAGAGAGAGAGEQSPTRRTLFGESARTGSVPTHNPHSSQSSPFEAAVTPAAQSSRSRSRGVLIGAGVLVVLCAVGVAVWLSTSSNNGTTLNASPIRTVNTAPGTADDITAVQDRTTEYLAAVSAGDKAKVESMRCAGYVTATTAPDEAPTASVTITAKEFISSNVIGDNASVRLRIITDKDGTTDEGVVLVEYVREEGQWMFCSVTDQ
ncbi:Hsp70 family protein [Rhodococcus erythropolis]|uniref:Hsp70 family protein n=1 Tax=Rhodococcus erythropolis TaxID=1833 RepID=UPI00294A7CA0|nr:Hsp70 family protein [Rhodococcus erythropolis]MDV6277493.1 Hsp70 family protein [Rhodococcus erythropolis]